MSTSGNPRLSFVISTVNRKQDLLNTLGELFSEEEPSREVIVVDNASTDGTADAVRVEFPLVRLLPLSENRGHTGGQNSGARIAHGQHVVLLNNDSYPKRGALARACKVLDTRPDVGVVAGNVYTTRTGVWDMNMFFPMMPSGLVDVPWFIGCAAVVRRDLFAQMGGYREEYFAYWEEIELSLRIWNEGYRIVLDPTVEFIHSMSSVNRSAATTTFYFTRNAIWLCRSAYRGSRGLRYALVLTMLNFGAALRSKDPVVVRAFARGVLQGIRRGPEHLTLDPSQVSICTQYMDKLFGPQALGARMRDVIARPRTRRTG